MAFVCTVLPESDFLVMRLSGVRLPKAAPYVRRGSRTSDTVSSAGLGPPSWPLPGVSSGAWPRPTPVAAASEAPSDGCQTGPRAFERQQTWAPEWVGDELAEAQHAVQRHRTDATVWAARADAAADPAEAQRLGEDAALAQTGAAVEEERVGQLQEADTARSYWYMNTAVARDRCERRRAALAARGVDVETWVAQFRDGHHHAWPRTRRSSSTTTSGGGVRCSTEPEQRTLGQSRCRSLASNSRAKPGCGRTTRRTRRRPRGSARRPPSRRNRRAAACRRR